MTSTVEAGCPAARASSACFQVFAASSTAPLRWRVLSGNNREMARSRETYADSETCRRAIRDLLSGLDGLLPQVRREGRHRWTWELLRDGDVLVVAAHPFDRQVRCRNAVDQFLQDVRLAPIAATVLVTAARRFRQRSARPIGSYPAMLVPRSGSGIGADAWLSSDGSDAPPGEVFT